MLRRRIAGLLAVVLGFGLCTGSAFAAGRRSKARRHKVVGHAVPESHLHATPARPSGKLHLFNVAFHESANVNIYDADGSYDVDALAEVAHVLRCKRTGTEKEIEPRLLTILSHVNDHFGGKTIELVSGYRNQRRETSHHFNGTAADIRVRGIKPAKVRAFIDSIDDGGMGLGLYPRSGFVHVDVRPLPSYRWVDYSRSRPNAADKRPPRGWRKVRRVS